MTIKNLEKVQENRRKYGLGRESVPVCWLVFKTGKVIFCNPRWKPVFNYIKYLDILTVAHRYP